MRFVRWSVFSGSGLGRPGWLFRRALRVAERDQSYCRNSQDGKCLDGQRLLLEVKCNAWIVSQLLARLHFLDADVSKHHHAALVVELQPDGPCLRPPRLTGVLRDDKI